MNMQENTPDPVPDHVWGLASLAPPGARAAWGARAIQVAGVARVPAVRSRTVDGRVGRVIRPARAAVSPTFDLVWDRQSATGEESERTRLGKALDAWGLKAARKAYAVAVKNGAVVRDEGGLVYLVNTRGLVIVGDTRASYGYVYLGAWFVPFYPGGAP